MMTTQSSCVLNNFHHNLLETGNKLKMDLNTFELNLQLDEENNNETTTVLIDDEKNIESNSSICNNNEESSNLVEESSADDGDDDLEDLTSLAWLTELKNITNLPPTASDPVEKPCDPPSQRFDKFIGQVFKIKENYLSRSDAFQSSPTEKPPYNYAQIIAMAMLEEGRMTLKQICDWIENHFAFYRYHKNWNNSIRHNLSLNFFFSKVARGKNEKGKGGYWELAVDSAKTSKKRIRHRKKKNCIISKNSRVSKLRRSNMMKIYDECGISTKSSNGTLSSDVFLSSSPSNLNENSNMSSVEQIITDIEVIEEQQNINNIIDGDAIIISNATFQNPNVIVETIPTYQFTSFNQINFDENELSEIICLNDQELIDDFLKYDEEDGEFL